MSRHAFRYAALAGACMAASAGLLAILISRMLVAAAYAVATAAPLIGVVP